MEPTGNYADIIVFAAVAVFVLWKLRAALGRKDGSEGVSPMKPHGAAAADSKVVNFPGKAQKSEKKASKKDEKQEETEPEIKDPVLARKVEKIKSVDKGFSPTAFLEGAKVAFEMLVKAFSEGDKETLKNLLSRNVYKTFTAELEKLAELKQKYEATLVSILSSDITDARVSGSKAQLEVEFKSEQVNLVKDADGKVVDGDPSFIEEIIDKWVFERDLKSSNPNWVVAAT